MLPVVLKVQNKKKEKKNRKTQVQRLFPKIMTTQDNQHLDTHRRKMLTYTPPPPRSKAAMNAISVLERAHQHIFKT